MSKGEKKERERREEGCGKDIRRKAREKKGPREERRNRKKERRKIGREG